MEPMHFSTVKTAWFALLLSFAAAGAVVCKDDPDETAQKYIYYKLLCPGGIDACYEDCGSRHDDNSNGYIDPGELREFNSCTNRCSTYCDDSFLYLYFTEGQ